MNLLVIPIDQVNHPQANVRLGPILGVIVDKKLLGVERTPYFGTHNEILKHFKFLIYFVQVVYHGLKYRRKIDLIFTESHSFGLIGAVTSAFTRKPLIWDTHYGNLLVSCQFENYSSLYTRTSLLLEKFIGRMARVIIVPSELDRKLYYEQKYPFKNKIKVIPSGIDLSPLEKIIQEFKEDKTSLRQKIGLILEKKILIFGGNLDYPPNKEAAFWLNNEFAPALEKNFKDIQVIITGSGEIPPKVHPRVTFTGHVPDYFEHILASDVCLVPYQMNTGISTKLIDYLACGRPTVTTVEIAGLFPQLVDGENILIARDKKEFIEKTITILENPALGEKIGANGRKVIEEHYNMEVIGKLWQEVFESCVHKSKSLLKKK